MNDRIKHLLALAHGEAENIKDTNWIANRFAELIVRECATRTKELGQPEIGQGLLKHFGVQE